MIFGVYSLRDVKTGFCNPTFDANDSVATRNFFHAIDQSKSIMRFAPEDFDLYKLADFDTDTGIITSLLQPMLIAQGVNFERRKKDV